MLEKGDRITIKENRTSMEVSVLTDHIDNFLSDVLKEIKTENPPSTDDYEGLGGYLAVAVRNAIRHTKNKNAVMGGFEYELRQ